MGNSVGKCTITMGSEVSHVNQIYQGEMFRKVCLIDNSELAGFKVWFDAEKGFDGNPYNRKWSPSEFFELGEDAGLLHYAVRQAIDQLHMEHQRIALSLEYGVFCDDTALFLNIKQEQKVGAVSGQTAVSHLNFGKIVTLSKHVDQYAIKTETKQVQAGPVDFSFSGFRGSADVQLTDCISNMNDGHYKFLC